MASLAFPSISELATLANGTTYNSVYIESKQGKPYILFLHGFPSSSFDWRHQISFFANLGYGVFAPDLLGYGGTDKPTGLEPYKQKQMSEDLVHLLDHHQIEEVIGIDSSTSIIYAADPDVFRDHLCPIGGIQNFYEKNMTGPLPDWISEREIVIHKQIFSPNNGGFRGGLNWYRAQIGNWNAADEKGVPPERYHTDKPTLLITCTRDYVAIPSIMENDTRAFAKDLVVESLDCGHWVQLQKAKEVNESLKRFIEKLPLKV
ncbi:MAG: hypothetical protein Q9209_000242 [Squamulea sp. 1 TL-2023]